MDTQEKALMEAINAAEKLNWRLENLRVSIPELSWFCDHLETDVDLLKYRLWRLIREVEELEKPLEKLNG